MSVPTRTAPFTFAEIVIGGPWVTGLLRNDEDNNRGEMLHRNIPDDERSAEPARFDVLALEREARAARAIMLGNILSSLKRRASTLFRSRARA